jgi:hypothetical protein
VLPSLAAVDSQAAPTPQPVPHSPSRPVRLAANAASNRPVSSRLDVTNPRRRDRSSARRTTSGSSIGALTARVFHSPDGRLDS